MPIYPPYAEALVSVRRQTPKETGPTLRSKGPVLYTCGALVADGRLTEPATREQF